MTTPRELCASDRALAREQLAVDPSSPSGLRWKLSKKGVREAGAIAGSRRANGYWYVGLNRRRVQAGRLVLILSGVEPHCQSQEVEHIDGNPSNNRRENLAWSIDNADQNLNRSYKTNSGFRWVHKQSHHESYFYQFVIPRTRPAQYVRGCGFDDPEVAYAAALRKRDELGLPIFTRC